VVRCRTLNPTLGCCVPLPTQRAIPPGSVNEYQQKLGSKQAYHAIHWPRVRGLAASAGIRLRAKETEISAAPWALESRGKEFFTSHLLCPLFYLLSAVSVVVRCGTVVLGNVIKAWDIGVASMKRGELAVLLCKSEYAYGKSGSGSKIPPDATLVFEVELFDWKGEYAIMFVYVFGLQRFCSPGWIYGVIIILITVIETSVFRKYS